MRYMQTRMSSGRGQVITSEGKKKRSEDNSETSLKRPKQENSSVTSVKVCHNIIIIIIIKFVKKKKKVKKVSMVFLMEKVLFI